MDPAGRKTFEGLGDAHWKGPLCVNPPWKLRQPVLVASVGVARGVEATEASAKKRVANFPQPPGGRYR